MSFLFKEYKKRHLPSRQSVLAENLLPEETWILIFSLCLPTDLNVLARVCKHFNQLTSDKALWRELYQHYFHAVDHTLEYSSIILSEKIKNHKKLPPYIKKIYQQVLTKDLVALDKFKPSTIEKLLQASQNLEINFQFPLPLWLAHEREETKILTIFYTNSLSYLTFFSEDDIHVKRKVATLCHQSVNKIIEDLEDINIPDEENTTLLHIAASANHLPLLKMLIHKGADLNALTKDNKTALEIAFEEGHHAAAVCLLDQDQKTKLKYCPKSFLRIACLRGDHRLVSLSLRLGADIDYIYDDATCPLGIACAQSDYGTVFQLLKLGANLNPLTLKSPLFEAIKSGNLIIVKLLLAHGADINIYNGSLSKEKVTGLSPLHTACYYGHLRIARYFLDDIGMDINLKVNYGTTGSLTPLDAIGFNLFNVQRMDSFSRKLIDMLKFLLNRGATFAHYRHEISENKNSFIDFINFFNIQSIGEKLFPEEYLIEMESPPCTLF